MVAQFTVRRAVDFVALAPIVLGFYPHKSLVMMTMSGFHARVDMPTEDGVQECIEALVAPVRRHNVKQVALVIFDDGDYEDLNVSLVEAFHYAGVTVVAGLQARDGEYRQFGESSWHPFHLASHPFTLEAQFEDRAPRYMSREAMVDSIQPRGSGWDGEVLEAVESVKITGAQGVIASTSREYAASHLELWSAALRGCEPGSEEAKEIALLVAMNAWLSGDGALSWAALDLADPESRLHKLISMTLSEAISPQQWDGL